MESTGYLESGVHSLEIKFIWRHKNCSGHTIVNHRIDRTIIRKFFFGCKVTLDVTGVKEALCMFFYQNTSKILP